MFTLSFTKNYLPLGSDADRCVVNFPSLLCLELLWLRATGRGAMLITMIVVCHRVLATKNFLPRQPCHLERLAFPPGSPAASPHLQETPSSHLLLRERRRPSSPASQPTYANTLALLFPQQLLAQIQGMCIACLLFLTAPTHLLRQNHQSLTHLKTST